MARKPRKYEQIFRDFCNSLPDSKLKERKGVAGDGKSPYYVMACILKKPARVQASYDQTEERKEINIHDFTKKYLPLFTIRDDTLTHITIEGEPTERTFISRDLKNPVTQSHQIIGNYDMIELRHHGGIYENWLWLEMKMRK